MPSNACLFGERYGEHHLRPTAKTHAQLSVETPQYDISPLTTKTSCSASHESSFEHGDRTALAVAGENDSPFMPPVDYQSLPSAPVFAFSPYDADFGRKVRFGYVRNQMSHEIREKKYGVEVASRYKFGYTPEESRNLYVAQQAKAEQDLEDALAESDSELEEYQDTAAC